MDPAVTKELKELLDKQKALQSEELMKTIAGSSRSYEDILRHIKGRAVRRRRLKTEQRAGLIGLVAPSERHVRLVVKSLEVHNLH